MRAGFIIELICDAPPDDVLRRVLDLRAHSRVIPLTRVTPEVAADQLAVGTVFVARTSVGPVGFDDPMRVDQLSFRPATATPACGRRRDRHAGAWQTTSMLWPSGSSTKAA